MKKTGVLTILISLTALVFCLSAVASDTNAKVKMFEQRANVLQSQIEQAKTAHRTALNNQIKAYRNSIDNLIRQRVQVDAQIARLEGEIQDVKNRAKANLERQVGQYEKELDQVKNQISGAVKEAPKSSAGAPEVKPEVKSEVKKEAKKVANASKKSEDKKPVEGK